jgi:hypothetical protein
LFPQFSLITTFLTMSAPLLPQEIIDNIISGLDWSGDNSLALISKAFRSSVQRLRFRHIALHDDRPDRTGRLSNAIVRNPTLGEYVQSVTLVYSQDKDRQEMTQALDMVQHVLRACHIQKLIIADGVVSQHMAQLFSPRTLPHLRSLLLGKVTFTPINLLHDVLSLHPPLDKLELWTSHLYIALGSPQREPIRVKRLRIMLDRAPIEDSWLLGRLYNVEEEVAISLYAPWAIYCTAPINQALQAWGSTPRRLRIDVLLGVLREF